MDADDDDDEGAGQGAGEGRAPDLVIRPLALNFTLDTTGSGPSLHGRALQADDRRWLTTEHGDRGRVRAPAVVSPRPRTANQRTQWAWMRTSLGMISLGLSITHIFTKQSLILGFVFILLGTVYGAVASVRYLYFFQYVDAGKFRTNSVFVTATTIFTLLGLSLVLILMQSQGRGTPIGGRGDDPGEL